MSSLFGGFQCFFITILVFIVIGYQRGWRREVISLVFVLLASVLINSGTSDGLSTFLGRIGAFFAFMTGASSPNPAPVSFLGGPVWSLIIFGGIVALGYFVGDKVFPKPVTPTERFIGIIPSVLSGVFILAYLRHYFQSAAGQPTLIFDLASTDPSNFVPIIFMIAILAIVVALIAARAKKKK